MPGGTAIRLGAHLEPGVVVMPPSYVNVGAWVGGGTMVDSHVLVGSCAQIGERVHLAAGVTIGGVLEPAGARPVIVEDDAFVGAGSRLLEGVLVRRGAVIGAGRRPDRDVPASSTWSGDGDRAGRRTGRSSSRRTPWSSRDAATPRGVGTEPRPRDLDRPDRQGP